MDARHEAVDEDLAEDGLDDRAARPLALTFADLEVGLVLARHRAEPLPSSHDKVGVDRVALITGLVVHLALKLLHQVELVRDIAQVGILNRVAPPSTNGLFFLLLAHLFVLEQIHDGPHCVNHLIVDDYLVLESILIFLVVSIVVVFVRDLQQLDQVVHVHAKAANQVEGSDHKPYARQHDSVQEVVLDFHDVVDQANVDERNQE